MTASGWTTRAWVALAVVLSLAVSGCQGSQRDRGNGIPAITTAPTGGTAQGAPLPGESSPLGVHWDPSRQGLFDPYLRTLRGSTTYYEVVWCSVEPVRGQRRWGQVDKISAAAQGAGITLMLKIRVGVCWATGGTAQHARGGADKTESAMPKDLAAYSEFVRDLVTRYSARGVHEYAIENEVNSPSYWSGSAQDYIALATRASAAIRAASHLGVVVDAGMSSTSYGYGIADRLQAAGQDAQAIAAYGRYFQRRIGTRGEQIPPVTTLDQLGAVLASSQGRRNLEFLSAARTLAQTHVVDVRQVHFYEPWLAVPDLVGYLHAGTPSGTPIEAWEVGTFWMGANVDVTRRTDEMVRSLALLLAGGVRKALWLPLAANRDNRHGEEVRYGLLDPDGTVRATGVTMRAMVEASRGATAAAVITGGLQGVAFQVSGKTTLVVWTTSGTVSVDVGAGARTAHLGSPFAPSPTTSVQMTSQPVLVQSSRSLADILGTG
ncbi:MAG: hypothetical protein ABI662_01330 [Dermatophilaceae bacterium]